MGTSDDYNVHVDLKRNTADKNVEISISAMDMESFKNVLPENLPAGPTSKLGTKTGSVWLNFQCAGGNYLRLGVNPKGAYNVMYVPGEGKMAHGEKMSEIKLPFELLPPRTEEYYVQILHFHKVKTEAGDVKSFTGAVCPSFEDGKEFSWKGCSSDKRYFGPFDEPALDKDM